MSEQWSPEKISQGYRHQKHCIDEKTATVIYLAYKLKRPLLIEGPPGVGKTELAKILSKLTKSLLVRIQCYEGLDESKALYDWNYHKQLLYLQAYSNDNPWQDVKDRIYSREFLLERPLLKAINNTNNQTLLLIDEIDKADEEFEALLLELLGEGSVTIPEYGTIKAKKEPLVFLTSNGSRNLSDPLKRRCLHLYLDYPSPEQELEILKLKYPELTDELGKQVVSIVSSLRKQDIQKKPSVAESIDWVKALQALGVISLSREVLEVSLALLIKNQSDYIKVHDKLDFFINLL
ncbi:MoxR-like ATPase [Desulfitispora alkaliphila]|uniref:AAA family ATPase n=1 Tax=Desulfitispora alkaliphila TaxID=622674 RepID=UPI003D19C37C